MRKWLTAILQPATCSKVRIALFLGLVSSSVFSVVTTDQLQIQTSPIQYIFSKPLKKFHQGPVSGSRHLCHCCAVDGAVARV